MLMQQLLLLSQSLGNENYDGLPTYLTVHLTIGFTKQTKPNRILDMHYIHAHSI